jgi:hypothetical protein
MDYQKGLQTFESLIQPDDGTTWADFELYKSQLQENLHKDRRFGSTETLRNERFQIVDKLNSLAFSIARMSFTDFCLGEQPPAQQSPGTPDVNARLSIIERKIDELRIEDREATRRILYAVAYNQIQQGEVIQIASQLLHWAQTVQQSGLPLNSELRDKLDILLTNTGNASQYLELTLPIIPNILNYKMELGSQHEGSLGAIWQRIKSLPGRSPQ